MILIDVVSVALGTLPKLTVFLDIKGTRYPVDYAMTKETGGEVFKKWQKHASDLFLPIEVTQEAKKFINDGV